ncbi:MAG: SAM-dependent chlorinase/fluorinase [Bryobacteraceae bacterium]|nr:SAM-dependent chlorinase/fluorinase [Bryobacteraceae bacterium]
MKRPLITLTTDFGLADHFVAAMKGVILGIAPQARIVDISHQIEPFAIAQAAFTLDQAARCFPPRSIHVAVVDPGVGSARRPLLVEAGGQYFIAPDNGLLTMIYARTQPRVRVISAQRYFRHPVSRTFHGRDIFAPVAAHLAIGTAPARFGKVISDYIRGKFEHPAQAGPARWRASILAVDRFGNLITNLPAADFAFLAHSRFRLKAGGRVVQRWVESYSEGAPGELLLIAGSSGYLEIATRQASAARLCGCAAGDSIELRCTGAGGAKTAVALTRTTAGRE